MRKLWLGLEFLGFIELKEEKLTFLTGGGMVAVALFSWNYFRNIDKAFRESFRSFWFFRKCKRKDLITVTGWDGLGYRTKQTVKITVTKLAGSLLKLGI